MLTFVESRPEEHPTKRTTFVRLDDECKITIGVEDGTAPRVDTHYNFSGLVTQYNVPPSEPNIQAVYTVEREETQMCRIAVRMYHGADVPAENRPLAGFYDYKPREGWCFFYTWGITQYSRPITEPGDIFYRDSGEDIGVGPQEFPVILWNTTDITRAGSLPGENTEPSLIMDAMIREQRDAKAISEGRGINYNACYRNLYEFLKHLDEVCDDRGYFFRGESEHYKSESLSRNVINSRLSRKVRCDFENVVKYSLNVESHGILYRHSPFTGFSGQYEADLLRSLFKRQIEELSIAKSPALWDDNSYSRALATEVRDLPRNAEEANFCLEDRQLLAEIQHYEGRTLLVDFTKNRDVALFFACKDKPDKDGRLMLLSEEHEGKMWDRISPSKTFPRYLKQESVLVVPKIGCLFPNGSASPNENNGTQCVVFNIPKELKRDILGHLAGKNITREELDIYGGCERIPDELRGYIEGQKSRVQKIFVPATSNTRVRLIETERF